MSTLLGKARGVLEEAEGAQEVRDFILESTKTGSARYVKCVSGARTPGIFKIARDHGKVVERTPPYRPEMQPIELI